MCLGRGLEPTRSQFSEITVNGVLSQFPSEITVNGVLLGRWPMRGRKYASPVANTVKTRMQLSTICDRARADTVACARLDAAEVGGGEPRGELEDDGGDGDVAAGADREDADREDERLEQGEEDSMPEVQLEEDRAEGADDVRRDHGSGQDPVVTPEAHADIQRAYVGPGSNRVRIGAESYGHEVRIVEAPPNEFIPTSLKKGSSNFYPHLYPDCCSIHQKNCEHAQELKSFNACGPVSRTANKNRNKYVPTAAN